MTSVQRKKNAQAVLNKPPLGLLIYLAASKGDKEHLQVLLQQENIMSYTDKVSDSQPVHATAAPDNPQCLNHINYEDEITGMCPIHAAAAWGNPNCIQILVDCGADINQHDELRCTPMHHAARNGHLKTFEWLKDAGANLVEKNLFGQSPADMALANDFPDLADQIRRAGSNLSAVPGRGFDYKSITERAYTSPHGNSVPNRHVLQWLFPCEQTLIHVP